MNSGLRRDLGLALIIFAALFVPGRLRVALSGQEAHQSPLEISVNAQKYSFSPARIEVQQNDIVKITLTAQDIAHSFTIDDYRIAKRAAPGHPVTFQFLADRKGTFPFYCNLTIDERCKEMRGELVVR